MSAASRQFRKSTLAEFLGSDSPDCRMAGLTLLLLGLGLVQARHHNHILSHTFIGRTGEENEETIICLLLLRQDQRCQQHLDGRAELPPGNQPQLSADPHGEQIVQSICTSLPCFHQGVHPDSHKHLPKPKARLLGGEALPESFDPRYNVLTHPYCTLHTLDKAVNNLSCLAG